MNCMQHTWPVPWRWKCRVELGRGSTRARGEPVSLPVTSLSLHSAHKQPLISFTEIRMASAALTLGYLSGIFPLGFSWNGWEGNLPSFVSSLGLGLATFGPGAHLLDSWAMTRARKGSNDWKHGPLGNRSFDQGKAGLGVKFWGQTLAPSLPGCV